MASNAKKRPYKKRPSKQQLVKRLENAANKATKKPIYSVIKENDSYSVIDYIKKTTVCVDIPFSALADNICTKYNSSKPVDKEIRPLLKDYYKHATDLKFYEHTYNGSTDLEKRAILADRMGVSSGLMKKTKTELTKFLRL